jgi:hypothetical protein
LQGTPQQHNLPSIFYQNEGGHFCIVVVIAACACFIVAWNGFSQMSALLIQRVSRV